MPNNKSTSATSDFGIAPVPLYPMTFPAYRKMGNVDPFVTNHNACLALYAKYRQAVDSAVRLCNVPKEIVLTILFTENASGNPSAVSSSGAIGLMQLKPGSASDTLIYEMQKGRLTQPELSAVGSVIGSSAVRALQTAKSLGKSIVAATNLRNPAFNILIGTMLLGQLIDLHTEGGIWRLDKVFARYNQGRYYDPGNGDASIVLANAKKHKPELYSYLLKTLGTNGIMQGLAMS